VIKDIIVSLVSSFLIWIISSKAIEKKSQKVIYTVYSLYLAFSAFITSILLCFNININFIERISKMTDVNVFTIYKYSSMSFILIFVNITIMTAFVISTESLNKSIKEFHIFSNKIVKLSHKTIDKASEAKNTKREH
jgi:hypothetical protein